VSKPPQMKQYLMVVRELLEVMANMVAFGSSKGSVAKQLVFKMACELN
jgi:hypothetical protein